MTSTAQDLEKDTGPGTDWQQVQGSAEFVELRRRLRVFVFPMTVLFLAWYLLYVLLADYAHGFMATKVAGNVNVGLIIGLLQFVSTFLITGLYVRYANRKLDPVADKIRGEIEGEPVAAAFTVEPSAAETKVEEPVSEAKVEAGTEEATAGTAAAETDTEVDAGETKAEEDTAESEKTAGETKGETK